ncbi:MAG TPA: hypothetical protein VM785_07835 [Gaiellales bacterium]|jgi:hypothetical protein|nr:hypothetical protein [Gaiellales bacterium]
MSISAHPPRRRRLSLMAVLAILSLIGSALLVAVAVTWPFQSDDVVKPTPPATSGSNPQPNLLPAVGKQGIGVKRMIAAFHANGFTLVPYDTAGARFDPIRRRIVAAYRFDNDAGRFVMVIARVPLVRFASRVAQLPTPLDGNEASGKLYVEYDSSLSPPVLGRIRAAIRAGAPAKR